VHLDLEAKIAQFMGTPDSILYSYGLATVSSVIPAFCKRGDLILADEGVNWGIQNGLFLSRSTVRYFKHNDMASLEALLEDVRQEDRRKKKVLNRRFIVVEAIYQNSGEMVPLDTIVRLKEKYLFRVLVDESNSIGVLGKTGRGLSEHFNIPVEKIDIITSAMGHSLASVGGFCTGSAKVVDHQVCLLTLGLFQYQHPLQVFAFTIPET
jgi:serine palmitoyltransferase